MTQKRTQKNKTDEKPAQALTEQAVTPPAPPAPQNPPATQTLTVTAPQGRRFRAGLEFGRDPRQVEVTPEQAATIAADPLLVVE